MNEGLYIVSIDRASRGIFREESRNVGHTEKIQEQVYVNRALRDTKFDNPRGSGITTNNHVSAARAVELKPEKRNGSKIN